jgi:hypothetical protein
MKLERFIVMIIKVTSIITVYTQTNAQIALPDDSSQSLNLAERFRDVIEEIEIAPVWSVHQIGSPNLITSDKFQSAAYYDKDRYLTIAK